MIPTGFLYDPACMRHRQGELVYNALYGATDVGEDFDSPLRPAYIKQLFDDVGLTRQLHDIPFTPASDEQLLRVHTPEYLKNLAAACKAAGETVVSLGREANGSGATEQIARLGAGAACAAVDAVMRGPLTQAYGLVRPSGHHAGPDFAMGFCYYNNAAIAARQAQQLHGVKRVAIVDWDVHHGNGTQAVFYNDPSVLYISLHEVDNFPLNSGAIDELGEGAGYGANICIPLPPGTGNAGYRYAFEQVVLPALRAFAPQLIVISAGQDPSPFDPQGRMRVQRTGFSYMAQAARELAQEVCGGRIVVLQEGGYSLPYLPIATLGVLEGLTGWQADFVDPHTLQQHPIQMSEIAAVTAARVAQQVF